MVRYYMSLSVFDGQNHKGAYHFAFSAHTPKRDLTFILRVNFLK